MSKKTEVNIPDNKKSSIVTIHETSFPTISIKLDGANYRVWSQIMDMHTLRVEGRRNISLKGRLHPLKTTKAMMNGRLKTRWSSLGSSIP